MGFIGQASREVDGISKCPLSMNSESDTASGLSSRFLTWESMAKRDGNANAIAAQRNTSTDRNLDVETAQNAEGALHLRLGRDVVGTINI